MSYNPSPRKRRTSAQMPGSTAPTPFANWTEDHPFYRGVRRWIMDRLKSFSDPAIFIILGPTGVGKSTMIQHLKADLAKAMKSAMVDDPSLIPYLEAEATYTPGVGLDWATFLEDLLDSGNDLLIDAKVENPTDRPGSRVRALLRAVNRMMLYRSPALGIIDEGAALVKAGSRGGLETNLNYLKSLGNRSKTHLAFFGDYGLAELAQYSGQLDRRCYFAHLPPYPSTMGKEFGDVVASFEKRAHSFGISCELCSSTDFLLANSCGCVGLLHRWIQEALVEARQKGGRLGPEVIKKTAPSVVALAKWRAEIASGAAKMEGLFKSSGELFEP